MNLRGDPRMAGEVKRWHTYPTLREQSVASHSWNVARIVLAIVPMASRELMIEALFHDTGEIKAMGDMPHTSKTGPEREALRKLVKATEREARTAMSLPWALPSPWVLGNSERQPLDLANMIEMWEFALHERMLGNKFADEVISYTAGWIHAAIKTLLNDGQGSYTRGCATNAAAYCRKRAVEWDFDPPVQGPYTFTRGDEPIDPPDDLLAVSDQV
jgi:hypothetical protein